MTVKASTFWGDFTSRSGSSGFGDTARAVAAHRKVEEFVNAFTRDEYLVEFAPQGSRHIAYTIYDKKRIFITPSPLTDPSLSLEDMADILSGLACHEISHTRYGVETSHLTRDVFGSNPNAHMLGNLLDDIRIERKFVAEYPGFASIFRAPMDYVGNRDCTGVPISHGDVAVRATRYDTYTDWSQTDPDERQWWLDWADRNWDSESKDAYVAAIREGLAYLQSLAQKQQQAFEDAMKQAQQTDDADDADAGEPGDGMGQGEEPSMSGAGANDDSADNPGQSVGQSNESSDANDESPGQSGGQSAGGSPDTFSEAQPLSAGACAGSAIDANDSYEKQMENRALSSDANKAIDVERMTYTTEDGDRVLPQVNNPTHKVGISPNNNIASIVRNAFMRSRSGNDNEQRFNKSGTLDERSLHRIAYGETNLFTRKSAPSPQRITLWLLCDNSGSMQGDRLTKTEQLAAAIAQATLPMQTIKCQVWSWSGYNGNVASLNWKTGMPLTQFARMRANGGTPDAPIIGWASENITKQCGNSTPVIIMLSDGMGSSNLQDRVAKARKRGVKVYSVALASDLGEDYQRLVYGKGNYITCNGPVDTIARPLANMIARLATS